MPAREAMAAADLKKAMVRYRDVLFAHQQELNDLNVYPVPDGDSGTNLRLTLDSVVERLDDAHDMVSVCRALSQGALRGARGNSGVIMSQFLHGFAKVFAGVDRASGADLAAALRRGSDRAYESVSRPMEGTILTVAREAAEAAESLVSSTPAASFAHVLDAAAARGKDALARTPEMLPELARAGVVDAGGKGVALFLGSMLAEFEGRPVPEPEVVQRPRTIQNYDRAGSPRYEVMLFLDADGFGVARLKSAWTEIGDSIIVAGEEGFYNCHIHTDHIGAVIEASIDAGTPTEIRVTDLNRRVDDGADEHQDGVSGPRPDEGGSGAGRAACALVALVEGEGARTLFEGLGADVVLDPRGLSIRHLASLISGLDSDSVLVVPNAEANAELARRAGAGSNKEVSVVTTSAATEGLAAIVVFDPYAGADSNAGAMTEAASRVKLGRVTAARGGFEAADRFGRVSESARLDEAVVGLLGHLVGPEDEVVTVLAGAGATPEVTSSIKDYLAASHPHMVAEVHEGGGPDPYLFGVE